MDGFIKWHKLMIGKVQSFLRIGNYESLWLSWLKGLIMGIIIMSLFSGCYIYDSAYYSEPYEDDWTHQHETIHYWNNNVYFGYYQGFYYYYGQPHWYPWHYYYTIRPQYTYSVHTHIHVHIETGYAVTRPRGPKFNNRNSGNYTPVNTSSVINKPTNKRPVINNNRVYIRPNINHNTNPNKNKVNTNKNKVNTNKNNVNINRNNKSNVNRNNKININRNNKTNVNKNTNSNKRSNRNKRP